MRQIEVSEETWAKIKGQIDSDEITELDTFDDLIGRKFLFRTVTYHMVGRVKKRIGKFLLLEQSSWVADTGRFMQAIKNGTLDEVEPVGVSYINTDSFVDFFPWKHSLPTEQK